MNNSEKVLLCNKAIFIFQAVFHINNIAIITYILFHKKFPAFLVGVIVKFSAIIPGHSENTIIDLNRLLPFQGI